MKVIKYIAALIFALLSLFSGGCAAVYLAVAFESVRAGQGDYGVTQLALAIGVLPSIVCGLIAWWLFRSARKME